jgi:apolipoprotein N-acyltransferase
MRTDRWLIASLVLLVSGVWSLLEWCHGTAGLSFAYPVAGTKLALDITSTGVPVLVGIPLIVFGLLFMFIALLAALLALFRPSVRPSKPAEPTPSTSLPKTS